MGEETIRRLGTPLRSGSPVNSQKRALRSGVLAVTLLLAATAFLFGSSLTNFTTITGTDFAFFGVGGMRGQGTGAIVVSGISGTVTAAYLYWMGPGNDSFDTNASVVFNGTSVTGVNIGTSDDNCWDLQNSQAYRATVTGLVPGNGTYALGNFRKTGPPLAEVNGVSLVIFYDDGVASNNRDYVIFNGNDSNISNPFDANGWNAMLSGIRYTSGPASMHAIVSDGQIFPDGEFRINGVAILPRGGSNWQGNTLPDQGTASSTGGGLWDHRTFDVTSLLAPGSNTLTVQPTPDDDDCLGLIALIFDLPSGAAPPPPPGPGVGGQTFNEFRICSAGGPIQIASGPDGALWFTESTGNRIGRITTNGDVSEFPIPTANSQPEGIATGPDGALWFTESLGNKIGRITTAGVITEFPLPTGGSSPLGIAPGADDALWFTESLGNKIGRITTAGVITEFPLPAGGSSPSGITAGPDGALWFTESGGHRIGRITTAGVITEFPLPGGSGTPFGIASGSDGAVWFAESGDNQIGRITTSGVISEFAIPASASDPKGITAGSDGNLWFTENAGHKVGRITTAGAITEFRIPTPGSSPHGIAAGSDGALWFAELGTNRIGRITTSGASGNRLIGTRFPLLADTSQSGDPGTEDTAIWIRRAGNIFSFLGPWEDCAPPNVGVFTGSNPDASGRLQTYTRFRPPQTHEVTLGGFTSSGVLKLGGFTGGPRPTTASMQSTGPAGNRSASIGLFDLNGDGIAEGIQGTNLAGLNFMISLVYSDVTGDGRADYVSLPWAQTSVLGVKPLPGTASSPQVWVPLADTTGDGIPDAVAVDLDGDGAADPDAFLGPIVGPNPVTGTPNSFHTLTPCRVIDTRQASGPFGGPALASNVARTFAVLGQCGIAANAKAISANLTVTEPTSQGHLTLFPAGAPVPLASSMNYLAGQTRANNAILLLGESGDFTALCAQVSGTTHFILDVNGYFAGDSGLLGAKAQAGRGFDWFLIVLTAVLCPAAWRSLKKTRLGA